MRRKPIKTAVTVTGVVEDVAEDADFSQLDDCRSLRTARRVSADVF